ncbi:unnamed protein product [Leptosia nina]|uniref:Cytochrome P450 n=1 Tax=Leptosia nina TaxID=320188 RepID=A0AAV1JQ18_9NEOP
MIAVLLFVALVLCYISFRCKRRRLYELAALIPEAPMPIPFIGALQYTINLKDLPYNIMNIIKRFGMFAIEQGGLIKFWAGPVLFVAMTDPTDVEFVLRKCLDKSNIMWLLQTVTGNSGIFAPVHIWVRRRKLTVPAFSPKIINSYTDILIQKCEKLAQRFSKENLVGTGTFKAWSYVSSHTLDTVFDYTKKKKELEDVVDETSNLQNGENYKTVRCFLDNLIVLSRTDDITDIELREEVLTFLFGGTDTTAVTLCNTLKLLAKYPTVQEKVYEEIMQVLGDPTRTITKDDLQQLKYLERVVKESLRLFPPAPILLRKICEETELPSGKILPADTHIFIGIWAAGRDPKHWGPDADCFDPDRFLPDRPTGLFVPFSCGPRNCIGTQFAFMSIKLAITALIRRYKITGEEEKGPAPHMDCSFNIMMKANDDYEIGLEVR